MTKCAVRFCEHDDQSSRDVTFFKFPQNLELRDKWLKIICENINDKHFKLNDSTLICSSHFVEADTYFVSGHKRLKRNAVPKLGLLCNIQASLVDVCRVCLATDVQMYSLQNKNLKRSMNAITATLGNRNKAVGLPQFICYECNAHLENLHKLIEKSRVAQETLLDIYYNNNQVTKSLVKDIDREAFNLQSPLTIGDTCLVVITDVVCKMEVNENATLNQEESANHFDNVKIFDNFETSQDYENIDTSSIVKSESGEPESETIYVNLADFALDEDDFEEDIKLDINSFVDENELPTHQSDNDITESKVNPCLRRKNVSKKVGKAVKQSQQSAENSKLCLKRKTPGLIRKDPRKAKIEQQFTGKILTAKEAEEMVERLTREENSDDELGSLSSGDDSSSADGLKPSSTDDENDTPRLSNVGGLKRRIIGTKIKTEKESCSKLTEKVPDVLIIKNIRGTSDLNSTMNSVKEDESPVLSKNDVSETKGKQCLKKKIARKRTRNPEEAKIRRRRTINASAINTDEARIIEKMSKCFKVIDLSLQEQREQWEKENEQTIWTKPNLYKCEICSKKFLYKVTFEKHVTHHSHARGQYECPVCKLRFKNALYLCRHTVRKHTKKYECKNCPKVVYNYVSATNHALKHSGRVYRCTFCPHTSMHYTSLFVHVKVCHETTEHCARCGNCFTNALGLSYHVARAHRGQTDVPTETFRCEQCDVVFYSQDALNVHYKVARQHWDLKKTLQKSPTACPTCAVMFPSAHAMLHHKRAVHGLLSASGKPTSANRNVYPQPCEYCGAMMSSRCKYNTHVRYVHPGLKLPLGSDRHFICDKCGKAFSKAATLRYHQARHGSPQLSCDKCHKKFYNNVELRVHQANHEGPFKCTKCDVTFINKGNVTRHMRNIHSAALSYECEFCDRKFKFWESLENHVRHTHWMLPWKPRARRPPRRKRAEPISTQDSSDSD